jgi:hypothetical protein
VVPQHLPVPAVVDELLLIGSATSPEDWTNRAHLRTCDGKAPR